VSVLLASVLKEGGADAGRAGRLWSSLLTYAVEAGEWVEAYAALIANPDPDRLIECLHHLLRQLIAARRVSAAQ
jgi:hypothetical protein